MFSLQNQVIDFIGESSSHKTQLIHKIILQQTKFQDYTVVGFDYYIHTLFTDLIKIKTKLMNTADLSHFHLFIKIINKQQIKLVKRLVFVYDTSQLDSFESIKYNLQWVSKQYPPTSKLLLRYHRRKIENAVPTAEAKRFAFQNQMMFAQISEQNKRDINQILVNVILHSPQTVVIQPLQYYLVILPQQINKINKMKNVQEIRQLFQFFINLKRQYSKIYKQSFLDQIKILKLQAEVQNLSALLVQKEKEIIQKNAKLEELKKYQIITQKINKNTLSQVIEVINIYEADFIKIREEFIEKEEKFYIKLNKVKEQCKHLENLCNKIQGINIMNAGKLLNEFQKEYAQYKLRYCSQDSIDHYQLILMNQASFLSQGSQHQIIFSLNHLEKA